MSIARADDSVSQTQQLEFFEKEVRPLLAEHCYACHSVNAKKLQAGLLVDSRASLLQGGDSGEAITPGDVDGSLLIEAVRYESYEMPPKGKLPTEDIETLERWVSMGAPWPEEEAPTATTSRPEFDLQQRRSEHWVWQPIRSPQIPSVANKDWPKSELDFFVLKRLEDEKLQPARDADRTALLRRIYFDLIGLPPTPVQIAKLQNDDSSQAIERLVDELLDSPHFGERWGRHWLDLVRYAESRGHEFDNDSTNAFQYRDYIIRALNADVAYDQLVHEHIAGDLLEEPRLNPNAGFNESILGTGFWFLGEWVHSPVDIRKDEADRFDNMIDVMSKTFLGVTVSCARCHDHKFDAISSKDYYSLSGFLQGSDYRQVRYESIEKNRQVAEKLAELDTKYQQSIANQLAAFDAPPIETPPLDEALAPYVAVDFAALSPEEFLQDGFIFGNGARRAGTAYLTKVDGRPTVRFARRAAAVSDPFWQGLESVAEKGVHNQSKLIHLPRSGRTLRTPTFLLTDGKVACRVRGIGHVVACVDSHRMIAGPLHGETIQEIKSGQEWVELNLHRYVGHRLHLEFTPAKNAQLEVSLVTQGASQQIRDQLEKHEAAVASAVETAAGSLEHQLTENAIPSLSELIKAWSEARSKLQQQVTLRSRLAMAMMDGTGEDDYVLIRGSSSNPGELAPRRFLTAIAGDHPLDIALGSGRLELARQINDPANPLTARVIVNRIWHYLMGRGIVPTTDDFGVLGQRPTHPELLDHLATHFVRDGQSLKRMIRYVILSRTYQMSSYADAEAVELDPKNLFWHHRPPKRLEGEVIRDTLLAISGRLDATQFGEPVPIHLTSFMGGRGRPKHSGPLEGEGRRSIYIAVRRNFLSPFMLTFDTPVPFSSMGRRNVSNVPAQALILMNDPFVISQAKKWAKRVVKAHETTESRVQGMYETAFARQPTPQELATAKQFLTDRATNSGVEQHSLDLWADFAHALINTKEFIFLR